MLHLLWNFHIEKVCIGLWVNLFFISSNEKSILKTEMKNPNKTINLWCTTLCFTMSKNWNLVSLDFATDLCLFWSYLFCLCNIFQINMVSLIFKIKSQIKIFFFTAFWEHSHCVFLDFTAKRKSLELCMMFKEVPE